MKKYRFKTEKEFKAEDLWDSSYNCPYNWNNERKMNHYMGKEIDSKYNTQIEKNHDLKFDGWAFTSDDYVEIIEEISLEQTLEQIKPLITKTKKNEKFRKISRS